MNNNTTAQKERALSFHDLHHAGKPLMLPNIWEPLGAALLANLGYPAVATSSSAMALTNGLLDGEHISFQSLLAQLKQITQTVSIPVTADIEKGYAANDKELAQHIESLIDTGIAGINFEDGNQSGGLVPIEVQCQRIQLIKETAERKGIPLFINSRTDTYIHSRLFAHAEEQLAETIKRGKAYHKAGADGFFPILIKAMNDIKAVVAEVPLPVNVMTIPGIPSFQELKAIGVKRISLGGAFLKTAMQAMKQQALLLKDFRGKEQMDTNEITSDYLEALITT